MLLRGVAAALALTVLGCSAERAAQRESAAVRDSVSQSPPYRILFIGNSLTYMHDMPRLLAGLARAGGIEVVVEQYALGGARLEGHAEDAAVRALLERGGWWAVMLQE